MCGIAGFINLNKTGVDRGDVRLKIMNEIQAHRGPDGEGTWLHENKHIGFAHRRLSIIDLDTGAQPMSDSGGNWVCFNGEIYNFIEVKAQLDFDFKTNSDTEVILAAYRKWGEDCVSHFNGMFAFALWDEQKQVFFCARDRFGIKPFYYTIQENTFYFASEMKTLLPFLPDIKTDSNGFKDYLFFQFCMHEKTMFEGIHQLRPGHRIVIKNGHIDIKRYWQVYFEIDLEHTQKYFEDMLEEYFLSSIDYHVRSDVPVGGYVSGGVDSSIVSAIATEALGGNYMGFSGRFNLGSQYDESMYANLLADKCNFTLKMLTIGPQDFIDNIENIIYYLDCPIAGPGSFPQYMVSQLASKHRKVVLGGQGGDEIFGGYTRYLVAYLERCLVGAIDDSAGPNINNPYIVTLESIIPSMVSLQQYKPMIKSFFEKGMFDSPDERYYQLVNRAPSIGNCINWEKTGDYNPLESFKKVFNAENIKVASYLDRMIHFDFKTLLPALLHVEDRVSMAHGIESRVPFLDHRIVELVAQIPANMKFKNGQMKYILRSSMEKYVPSEIINRKDKMGFPTPFAQWAKSETRDFIMDILSTQKASNRELINNKAVIQSIEKEGNFGRNLWGMLCLELWQRNFHDKSHYYREMLNSN